MHTMLFELFKEDMKLFHCDFTAADRCSFIHQKLFSEHSSMASNDVI